MPIDSLILDIPALSCGHCVKAVTEAVQAEDPTARVEVDLGSKRVTIASSAPPAKLRAALTDAGYAPA